MEGGSSGRGGVSSTEVGIPEAWLDTEAAKIAEKNHALLRQVSTRISHLSQNEHAMSDTVGPAAVEVDGELLRPSRNYADDRAQNSSATSTAHLRTSSTSPISAAPEVGSRDVVYSSMSLGSDRRSDLVPNLTFEDEAKGKFTTPRGIEEMVQGLKAEVRKMNNRIKELEEGSEVEGSVHSESSEPSTLKRIQEWFEELVPVKNDKVKPGTARSNRSKSSLLRISTARSVSNQSSVKSEQILGASIKKINRDVCRIVAESKSKKSSLLSSAADSQSEEGSIAGNDDCEAPEQGLSDEQAEALLRTWGKNELVEKVTPKWLVFLRLLMRPMPIMLWIASLIEGIIGNYADMAILLFIQFANASISFYESTKAGDAVAALKASLKPKATVKRNNVWAEIDATLLVPGDRVLLAAGSAVPADCIVNGGIIEVDQSAMTGESLAVKFKRGEVCKLGSNVVRGETEGTVKSTGRNTFFGKTATMLQSVENDAGSLNMLLSRIMITLVSLSLTLCTIALIYLIVRGRESNATRHVNHQRSDEEIIRESLSFAVVVLVASIPLAIEIVTTTTLALGSRALSMKGAIVTRLSSIEEMAGMNCLCSDKTGTLTLNKMVIQKDSPTYSPGETFESLLFQAALATRWKEPPRDALDTMILVTSGQDISLCNAYRQLEYVPFDPRLKRTEALLLGPEDKLFRITKGAPQVVLDLCRNKNELRFLVETKVQELGSRGIRSLALARQDDEDGVWKMLGILTFLDPPRPDTQETIKKCKQYGVEVKMITGDHLVIAKETSRVLGMGNKIYPADGLPVLLQDGGVPSDLVEKYGEKIIAADGFASVFPEHKYLIVETLRQAGFRCGMTGDGVNDAPALKRADVGIAVQGSTDAARAAADLVLTGEGLSTIVDGIEISREIFARLKNFITYRISATMQLLTFFFIAVIFFPPEAYYNANGFVMQNGEYAGEVLSIPRVSPYCPTGFDRTLNEFEDLALNGVHAATTGCPDIVLPICETQESGDVVCMAWPSYFQMPVLMLMLITLLNDGALISVGYDIVQPSPVPEHWNLSKIFLVSTVMGGVAMGSSLLLLHAALDSNNPSGYFAHFGFPPLEYGKIITMIYLKVALSDFLTLFSCRTQGSPFWTIRPGLPLLLAVVISLAVSTLLAAAWPEGTLDGLPVKGLALGNYKTWIVWVWIYCILWWFVQDIMKVATIYVLDLLPYFR